MNKKIYAFTSAIANTFCDFSLDIAINKYNIYKVLFYTSIISFFFQVIYATQVGISFTINSIPIILWPSHVFWLFILCKIFKKYSYRIC